MLALSGKDEFDIPMIRTPVNLGKDLRFLQNLIVQSQLLRQNPLSTILRGLPLHQMGQGQHPSLAILLYPRRIEGTDMILRGIDVEPA